ncbi:MAG: hypothetical protein AVDCRST_MAG49-3107, partial [uncultured Thermomicrobiales bacterium]
APARVVRSRPPRLPPRGGAPRRPGRRVPGAAPPHRPPGPDVARPPARGGDPGDPLGGALVSPPAGLGSRGRPRRLLRRAGRRGRDVPRPAALAPAGPAACGLRPPLRADLAEAVRRGLPPVARVRRRGGRRPRELPERPRPVGRVLLRVPRLPGLARRAAAAPPGSAPGLCRPRPRHDARPDRSGTALAGRHRGRGARGADRAAPRRRPRRLAVAVSPRGDRCPGPAVAPRPGQPDGAHRRL